MMRPRRIFAGMLFACAITTSIGADTALDVFVKDDAAAFTWKRTRTLTFDTGQVHLLTMMSQTWRTSREVDRPKWVHDLIVYVPKNVAYDTALLMIGGGTNVRGRLPDEKSVNES